MSDATDVRCSETIGEPHIRSRIMDGMERTPDGYGVLVYHQRINLQTLITHFDYQSDTGQPES